MVPSAADTRFGQQFEKTELCRFWQRKRCRKGRFCHFAHGEADMREKPDLFKTSMCHKMVIPGGCTEVNCKFAHHIGELRSTATFHKTAMCSAFRNGHCRLGDQCRHAHTSEELRLLRLGRCKPFPALLEQRAAFVSGLASNLDEDWSQHMGADAGNWQMTVEGAYEAQCWQNFSDAALPWAQQGQLDEYGAWDKGNGQEDSPSRYWGASLMGDLPGEVAQPLPEEEPAEQEERRSKEQLIEQIMQRMPYDQLASLLKVAPTRDQDIITNPHADDKWSKVAPTRDQDIITNPHADDKWSKVAPTRDQDVITNPHADDKWSKAMPLYVNTGTSWEPSAPPPPKGSQILVSSAAPNPGEVPMPWREECETNAPWREDLYQDIDADVKNYLYAEEYTADA